MKKLLCLTISVLLVASSFSLGVFANNGKGSGAQRSTGAKADTKVEVNKNLEKKAAVEVTVEAGAEVTVEAETETTVNIEDLRTQLKEQHKDKEKRKELIKKIVQLRKQNHDDSKAVFVNGKDLKFDVPPVIKAGRMVVPVRPITEAMGAQVTWNVETKTITIVKEADGVKTEIVMVVGASVATVNGVEVQIGAQAEVTNNRTIVPLRFIAETFKLKVEYDDETGSAIIDNEDEDSITEEDTTDETTTEETATDETTADETTTTDTTDTTTDNANTTDTTTGDTTTTGETTTDTGTTETTQPAQ